jgi:hypothetical protein
MNMSLPIDPERDVTAKASERGTARTIFGLSVRSLVKILISAGLTALVFYLVLSRTDGPSLGPLWTRFSAQLLLVVVMLATAATLLSAWRLKLISQDLGYRLSVRDSIAALSIGVLAGTMFFQLIGQLMARSALLSRRGMPVAATITLTVYERAAAAGVSLLMAIAGGWYVFGRVTLDVQHGGLVFLKIMAGLTLAIAAGGWFAWGAKALAAAPRKIDSAFLFPILRNVVLSTTIQLATMAAYIATAHVLAPGVPLLDLAAASAVVMLAASLPISLAGWGVRELSSVLALGAVGVPNDAALLVAVVIGITSLLVVGGFALFSAWFAASGPMTAGGQADSAVDYGAALAWTIPILSATALFFQLYIPVGKGQLNVNLADPLAIVGGGLFLMMAATSRRLPEWRLSWFNTHIAAISAVLALALLHGAMTFGWTSWAVTNRFVGWFILLGYCVTGAMIVRSGGREGLQVLLKTFSIVPCSIVVLDLFLTMLTTFGVDLPNEILFARIAGFAQNPNAFAFQVTLALCASLVAGFQPRLSLLVTTLCLVGIWFAASRAVFIALPFVLALAIYVHAISARRLFISVVLAAGVVLFIALLPPIKSVIVQFQSIAADLGSWASSWMTFIAQYVFRHTIGVPDPLPAMPPWLPDLSNIHINPPALRYDVPGQFTGPNTASSNAERIISLQGALNIFSEHPIIGGGLGVFVDQYLREAGKALVIHSTPLWLLAETGLIGALIVASLFARTVLFETPRTFHYDRTALLLVLIIAVLGVVSLVHELFYQRGFWFLFGAAMALTETARSRNASV